MDFLTNLKSVVGGLFFAVQARLSRKYKEVNFLCDVFDAGIENASESDPRTCEATKAVVKKTHKFLRNIPRNIWPSYDDLLLYASIVNSGQLPF